MEIDELHKNTLPHLPFVPQSLRHRLAAEIGRTFDDLTMPTAVKTEEAQRALLGRYPAPLALPPEACGPRFDQRESK